MEDREKRFAVIVRGDRGVYRVDSNWHYLKYARTARASKTWVGIECVILDTKTLKFTR